MTFSFLFHFSFHSRVSQFGDQRKYFYSLYRLFVMISLCFWIFYFHRISFNIYFCFSRINLSFLYFFHHLIVYMQVFLFVCITARSAFSCMLFNIKVQTQFYCQESIKREWMNFNGNESIFRLCIFCFFSKTFLKENWRWSVKREWKL